MRTNAGRRVWLERWRRVPEWAIDAVVGTVVVVGGVLSTGDGEAPTYEARDALAWALILAATLPYYLRRRAPLTVFVVSATAAATLMLLGYDPGALPFALLVGGFTVAAYRPAGVVAVAGAVLAALLAALYLGGAPEFGAGELVSSAAAYAAAMLLGWTMQTRSRHIEALEQREVESKRRAAADERLRIAQELHDIVAHSLGVIAVQAGVGMHVVDADPAEARRALEHISRTSRSSLAEIRRLLGVLRTEDGPGYAPAPGLGDLGRLTRDVTGAGLPVEVEVAGDLDGVPPGVGLAAYRIVQEALTNSLRHAGARQASVRLEQADGTLLVEVTDDGRGPSGDHAGGGHGLVGMRERVAIYGGSLDTGAAPDGGFRVSARLSYDAEPVT